MPDRKNLSTGERVHTRDAAQLLKNEKGTFEIQFGNQHWRATSEEGHSISSLVPLVEVTKISESTTPEREEESYRARSSGA